jgi:hypothetical protein
MAKLDAAERRAMPQGEYALPGRRFPLNDATHDRMAISGATRSERAGNISASQADKVKAEARAKLGHPREHALTMASADHLHRGGYIGDAQHREIRGKAAARMDAHKAGRPFGALG